MNTEPINPRVLEALELEKTNLERPGDPEDNIKIILSGAAPSGQEIDPKLLTKQIMRSLAKELRSLAGNPGMQTRVVTMQNALQIIANRLEQQARG